MLINLTSFDEGHGGYKNYYVVNNFLSNRVGDGLSLRAYFTYDEETKTGTVTFPYGWAMGEVELGGNYGVQSFTFYEGILENGKFYINDKGGTVFDYNDDLYRYDSTAQRSNRYLPLMGIYIWKHSCRLFLCIKHGTSC